LQTLRSDRIKERAAASRAASKAAARRTPWAWPPCPSCPHWSGAFTRSSAMSVPLTPSWSRRPTARTRRRGEP